MEGCGEGRRGEGRGKYNRNGISKYRNTIVLLWSRSPLGIEATGSMVTIAKPSRNSLHPRSCTVDTYLLKMTVSPLARPVNWPPLRALIISTTLYLPLSLPPSLLALSLSSPALNLGTVLRAFQWPSHWWRSPQRCIIWPSKTITWTLVVNIVCAAIYAPSVLIYSVFLTILYPI